MFIFSEFDTGDITVFRDREQLKREREQREQV
jgi:hypothetical protein